MSKLVQTKKFKARVGDQIVDAEITITQLPGMKGGKTLVRLGEILGPGLGGLSAAIQQARPDQMSAAVASLFKAFSGDTYEELMHIFCETATIKLKGIETELMPQWDLCMQGMSSEWFKILWFALEVNYGNFTDALAGLDEAKLAGPLKDLLKMAKAPLAARPEVTEVKIKTTRQNNSSGPQND